MKLLLTIKKNEPISGSENQTFTEEKDAGLNDKEHDSDNGNGKRSFKFNIYNQNISYTADNPEDLIALTSQWKWSPSIT